MFYDQDKLRELNRRQTSFQFKDISEVYQWNSKTKIFELVERNFREELDENSYIDMKDIINKTGQYVNARQDDSSSYFDASVIGDMDFHDLQNTIQYVVSGNFERNLAYAQDYYTQVKANAAQAELNSQVQANQEASKVGASNE